MTRLDDMPSDPGIHAADSVPMREAIDLLEEAIAFFDADCRISATNESFREAYGGIGQYIQEGSSWEIFLLEAERHDALEGAVCQELRLAETMLGAQSASSAPVEFRGEGNRAY